MAINDANRVEVDQLFENESGVWVVTAVTRVASVSLRNLRTGIELDHIEVGSPQLDSFVAVVRQDNGDAVRLRDAGTGTRRTG
jgi:hypothetical protein